MDQRVVKDVARKMSRLERGSTRLRFGRVASDYDPATDPLSVVFGDAGEPLTDVRSLEGALAADDFVAVLVSGNDRLVLGKVT